MEDEVKLLKNVISAETLWPDPEEHEWFCRVPPLGERASFCFPANGYGMGMWFCG